MRWEREPSSLYSYSVTLALLLLVRSYQYKVIFGFVSVESAIFDFR
jgi:hypothetical protein